jgi:hypothetical protein
MVRIWIASTEASSASGLWLEGKTGSRARYPGMSNSQIGEEILFEVIRFRHFGSILYFGE